MLLESAWHYKLMQCIPGWSADINARSTLPLAAGVSGACRAAPCAAGVLRACLCCVRWFIMLLLDCLLILLQLIVDFACGRPLLLRPLRSFYSCTALHTQVAAAVS